MIVQLELVTVPRGSWMAPVEDAARELLASHPHFRGRVELFEFIGRGDVLIVRGRVPTFYLKQLVQSILRDVEGVRRIDNQVDVTCCDGLSSIQRQGTWRPPGREE